MGLTKQQEEQLKLIFANYMKDICKIVDIPERVVFEFKDEVLCLVPKQKM